MASVVDKPRRQQASRSNVARSPYPMYRLTVDQYHKMIDIGVLTEDDRAELIKGWLVQKQPQSPEHAATISRIDKRLRRSLDSKWEVTIRTPVTTVDSEPEPDLGVIAGPAIRYFERHPSAGEVELSVEVADSSLEQDRFKAEVYASINVPIYWIINLPDRQIDVYSGPSARKAVYRNVDVYKPGDRLPLIVGGREVATFTVDELLPPTKKRRKPKSSG